jgi:protein involved in polysaccharide export with SLBB domain
MKASSLWLRAWTWSVVVVAGIALTGCATKIQPSEEWPAPLEPTVFLQPGDTVSFKFAHWPELDIEEQVIRPDGKVTLILVGDYAIGGKTPEEAAADLKATQYADKLKFRDEDNEIQIFVDNLDSRRVFVGGEVRAPGMQPLSTDTTALEAIMAAGGPIKESAKMDRVVVIRQRDGKQYAQTLDLKVASRRPESEQFVLEPQDIVIVPRTGIDRVNQWVEQYVNKMIPRSVYFNLTHPIGPDASAESTSTNFTFPVANP